MKVIIVLALIAWFIITTIAVLDMPSMEYKFHSWAIVACGPIAVVMGLWEVFTRLTGRGAK